MTRFMKKKNKTENNIKDVPFLLTCLSGL